MFGYITNNYMLSWNLNFNSIFSANNLRALFIFIRPNDITNDSKINLNEIFDGITFNEAYLISPLEIQEVLLGKPSEEIIQKFNVSYLDYDQKSALPTKILLKMGEVQFIFIINDNDVGYES